MHVELTQQHIDLVNSVLYNLPDGESEVFWRNSNYRRFVTNLVKNYFMLAIACPKASSKTDILSPLLDEEDTVLLYCDASIAKV